MVEQVTYSVCINSINKISGLNNNCIFNIPWLQVLPTIGYDKFKVKYNFQSTSGYCNNTTSSAKISCDFGSRSYNYDTTTSGPSTNLGVIIREKNIFYALSEQNISKTISKPINNQLNIQIINNYNNKPLYDTDVNGNDLTDMTSWVLYLEFIPIN